MAQPEVYDHEILEMETLLRRLRAEVRTDSTDLEGFRLRAIEEFAKIGWVANILTFETNIPNVYSFEFEVTDRVARHDFDHERQAHEVQHDILEIDQPGTITADGKLIDPKRSF